MRIPVYFIQEIAISTLCIVASGFLIAVGSALVKFLNRRGKHERDR
jgi:hypothetical protein